MKLKVYSKAQARRDIPKRRRSDNKTHGGKCLVIAGSVGMWGAAVLCAKAASRSGAGYVYVFNTTDDFPIFENPDFLLTNKIDQRRKAQAQSGGQRYADRKRAKRACLAVDPYCPDEKISGGCAQTPRPDSHHTPDLLNRTTPSP